MLAREEDTDYDDDDDYDDDEDEDEGSLFSDSASYSDRTEDGDTDQVSVKQYNDFNGITPRTQTPPEHDIMDNDDNSVNNSENAALRSTRNINYGTVSNIISTLTSWYHDSDGLWIDVFNDKTSRKYYGTTNFAKIIRNHRNDIAS